MSEALQSRVNELEDAMEEIMGIWEGALSNRDTRPAGAEMVRIARLASLRRLEDGTSLDEVREQSLRELRHKVIKLNAQLETARAMLRDWNQSPMADTLRVTLDSQMEHLLDPEEKAELEAARKRVNAKPSLEIPEDADEITKLRYIVGLQGLLLTESGHEAVAEFMEKQRFRMGGSSKCPECGYEFEVG